MFNHSFIVATLGRPCSRAGFSGECYADVGQTPLFKSSNEPAAHMSSDALALVPRGLGLTRTNGRTKNKMRRRLRLHPKLLPARGKTRYRN
jgi:hypothetical protein